MSTYDSILQDPEPKTYRKSGPFTERLKTVAEAVAFCERNGLDPSDAMLAHNYVVWDYTETAEEAAERVARAEKRAADHVEKIAEIHAEYVERGLIR